MSKVYSLLFLFCLTGCQDESQSDKKAELFGEWVSNKGLTLKSIDATNAPVPDAIRNSFGQMAYIFKPKQITFTSVGSANSQDRWFKWHVLESTQQYASIEISGLGIKTSKIKFKKEYGCLGLQPDGQAFTEYFCKQ
jgi:hypothetical protein